LPLPLGWDTVFSVDQIFDRLGNLLKSTFQNSGSDYDSGFSQKTGDPDLDAAYAELNDFLNSDLTESERREREDARQAEARKQAEEAARRSGQQSQQYAGQYRPQAKPSAPSPYPQGLVKDFELFNLKPNVKLPEVKSRYKKLLMENHPDRYAGNPDSSARATEYCVRLNSAFQRIEVWYSTGTYKA
jgi:hypothetical protein